MKILYAAGNHIGSNIQFDRFLASLDTNHIVKLSAYSANTDYMDYNLDALDFFDKHQSKISFNGNFYFYLNEIKRYSPDIIISDFDIYTSIIAIELGIRLWNYSSILFYYAIDKQLKDNLKIYQRYSSIIDTSKNKTGYINYIINNADMNLICSHLCEFDIGIDAKFKWSRPLYKLSNDDNYAISDGSACSLADNFYNRKYSYHNVKHDDICSVVGSFSNEHFGLGSSRDKSYDKKYIEFDMKESVDNICLQIRNP